MLKCLLYALRLSEKNENFLLSRNALRNAAHLLREHFGRKWKIKCKKEKKSISSPRPFLPLSRCGGPSSVRIHISSIQILYETP